MKMKNILLILILFNLNCVQCQNMESIESTVQKKPGETLTLSCRGSGFSFDCCAMHWIRQQAGKPLVWMGLGYSSGSGHKAESFKERLEISRDDSKSMMYLKLSGLTEEDSAVYFCAREGDMGGYAFDYWGKGTMVTVSSAQPSAPKSIFALSQCPAGSSEFLTVGCLARGFWPADSLTFKWKDSDKDLDTVVQYPAFGSDGDYTKISHMRVKKSDWIQNPYICEASNSKGSVNATVTPPGPVKPPVEPPKPSPRTEKPPVEPPKPSPATFTLTLRPPVERELFVNNKVVLEAVVSGDVRKTVQEASVSCEVTVNTVPVSANIKSGNVFTDNSLFIRVHNVTIDEKTWFDGEIVTCTIRDTNNNRDIKQNINFDKGNGQKPNVAIYRPDLINKDTVSVVCEVTSQKLGNVYIMWKVGGKPYKEAVTSAPIHQKSSTSVLSILTVSKQEYEDLQTTIACAVKHANMGDTTSPLQVTTSKSKQPECPVCDKDYKC